MKKFKIILLPIVIFAMLFAAGCSGSPTTGDDEPGAPGTSGQIPPPSGEVVVSIYYLTEEILTNYTSLFQFIDADDRSDDAVKILIATNTTARDYQYVEIGNEGSKYFVKEVLYSSEALLPETPFFTSWLQQGTVPHRGITFIDEKGETRCFYITASGDDGSVMLVEFN